jgi:hypothetical protein
MGTDLKWYELMNAFFGVKLSTKKNASGVCDVEVWQEVLRKKGANGKELSNVLQFMATQSEPPRADKTKKTSAYDLRDLCLWIDIYRKNKAVDRSANERALPTANTFTEGCCTLIDSLLSYGEKAKAALVALGNPEDSYTEELGFRLINELMLPNRGATEGEIISIQNHCRKIGFNYGAVLYEYAKSTGYKGSETPSGGSSWLNRTNDEPF